MEKFGTLFQSKNIIIFAYITNSFHRWVRTTIENEKTVSVPGFCKKYKFMNFFLRTKINEMFLLIGLINGK